MTKGRARGYRAGMTTKVRRGLGLLVLAPLALLIAFGSLRATDGMDNQFVMWPLLILCVVAGITFWVSLIGGLGLLAWGLLRASD